jgi:hypothetical protein
MIPCIPYLIFKGPLVCTNFSKIVDLLGIAFKITVFCFYAIKNLIAGK